MTLRLPAMFVLALGAAAAFAQGASGTVAGKVSDFDGNPVPSASVELKNTATGASFKSPVTPQGDYSIGQLPPGTYDLTVTTGSNRFQAYTQKGLVITGGQTARTDISLRFSNNLGTLGDDLGAVANDMRAKVVPKGPAPRMPDGRPDLSGVWLNVTEGNPATPLPLQPWADKIRSERVANNSKDMPQGLCQPSSPIQIVGGFPYKLVQTPKLMIMLEEFDVAMVRQIFLDGRPHPDPKTGKMGSRTWNPSWLGHSVGTWDGDTLVVDTVGFNDRSWFMTSPHSDKLHVVERLRRPDMGHLELDVTAEDSEAFTGPWKRHLIATLADPEEEIQEFICNEDNIDIPHLVGK